MSACADEEAVTHYCVVCGPCLRLLVGDEYITCHNNVPHPIGMTHDEEERPQ